jgi:hypothetical protein
MIDAGFLISARQIGECAELTNSILTDLPAGLYRSLDYKTISAIIGSVFCDALASRTEGIVNPIEKGHPDIIPPTGAKATEEQLRNYPEGLEVKCTVGNIEQGANLRAGEERVGRLTGITWQAHHREVKELMGLVWDFVHAEETFRFPGITAAFYADNLNRDDWGQISGTTGRNTKVTGMRTSGKQKMGLGWLMLIDDSRYLATYSRVLGFPLVTR